MRQEKGLGQCVIWVNHVYLRMYVRTYRSAKNIGEDVNAARRQIKEKDPIRHPTAPLAGGLFRPSPNRYGEFWIGSIEVTSSHMFLFAAEEETKGYGGGESSSSRTSQAFACCCCSPPPLERKMGVPCRDKKV